MDIYIMIFFLIYKHFFKKLMEIPTGLSRKIIYAVNTYRRQPGVGWRV